MNEQQQQITRVSEAIAPHICHFLDSHLNQEFHADDLRRYVAERTMIAPGSADRVLRDLRRKGIVNYMVVSRSRSLYKSLPVSEQTKTQTCSVEGCKKNNLRARGLCRLHYEQWRIWRNTHAPRLTGKEYFWSKVSCTDSLDDCWEWQGNTMTGGYGSVQLFGLNSAHRIAYYLSTGQKPTLHVLHSCDNPPCCNPHHLFLGTHLDNMRDKVAKGRAWRGMKPLPFCRRGHERSSENTRIRSSDGARVCRVCLRLTKQWSKEVKNKALPVSDQGVLF